MKNLEKLLKNLLENALWQQGVMGGGVMLLKMHSAFKQITKLKIIFYFKNLLLNKYKIFANVELISRTK